MSLVPVPEGPWRYLPYVFGLLLVLGMTVSGRARIAGPPTLPGGVPQPEAAD
jgi:hypothetical protein